MCGRILNVGVCVCDCVVVYVLRACWCGSYSLCVLSSLWPRNLLEMFEKLCKHNVYYLYVSFSEIPNLPSWKAKKWQRLRTCVVVTPTECVPLPLFISLCVCVCSVARPEVAFLECPKWRTDSCTWLLTCVMCLLSQTGFPSFISLFAEMACWTSWNWGHRMPVHHVVPLSTVE